MITYSEAHSPKWGDVAHESLSLVVTFDHCGTVPFTCMANDTAHGSEIFARAVAGDFGPVSEYVAPVVTAEMVLADKKLLRQSQVDAIKVTTHAGHVFDGDEISQGRMARAILGMQTHPGITINWVMANDVPTPVNAAELTEALALAGMAQAAIWSEPYA